MSIRNKTSLTQSEKDFIQTHLEQDWSLDVIKGTYPDRIPCSMRTLYRLVDRGILKKEDLPWKGKRKPNGHSEKRGKQAFRRDLRERADSYPNFKTEFGHLEGDTIVGEKHKSAVITLVESCSKTIITLKTNEHSNGLLRRNGLPKQMDFTNISQNYLSAIADKRNKGLKANKR